jgi:hypothetical protein
VIRGAFIIKIGGYQFKQTLSHTDRPGHHTKVNVQMTGDMGYAVKARFDARDGFIDLGPGLEPNDDGIQLRAGHGVADRSLAVFGGE